MDEDEDEELGPTSPLTPTVDDQLDRTRTLQVETPARRERYRIGQRIGVGGMGEVMAAHDEQIGREVAVKRLKVKDPTERSIDRFLREARIQGRLDHPAIVPVYELGRDPGGLPFFTMKKLAGTTLAKILRGDPADPRFTRQRLLRAFADVCLAIEFAHVRGVIHRDLKPSNIILGDFGEVYVIDWGISKVIGEADDLSDVRSDGTGTGAGTVIGTPGYLAPEQATSASDIDGRADVYALGCVLYEILFRQPLHSTRPTDRTSSPAIAPELDALWRGATRIDRTDRIATARELGESIQRYIDGDRDLAVRRRLAEDRLEEARIAYTAGKRPEALRAAGRALALDPESEGAGELVSALMLEPPDEPPPDLRAALETAEADRVKNHARTAVAAYFMLVAFLPMAMWNGILKWDVVIAAATVGLGLAFAAYRIMRRPARSFGQMFVYALANIVLMALLTRMAGPFNFVPGITCIVVMSVMAYPAFIQRPWLLIGMIAGGFLVPIGLELIGWFASTWEVVDGALISHANAVVVRGAPTIALLIAASVATIAVAGFHAARFHRTNSDAQRRLVTQAWHLRQLLPAGPGLRPPTAHTGSAFGLR